jgi:hypothetical protein
MRRFWGAACIFLLFNVSSGVALEDIGSHSPRDESVWIEEHLASFRQDALPAPLTFAIPRTELWTRGLATQTSRITPVPSSKALGAKLKPFEDFDFSIGTELSRTQDVDRALQSALDWQLAISQKWKGLTARLFTSGAVNSVSTTISQAIGATLGLPLAPVLPWSKARLEVSPQVNFEPQSGHWNAVLTPEIVSERVVSPPEASLESILRLKVGYGLTLHEEPNASARVELQITPRF